MNNTIVMELQSELPPGFRFHPTDEELITYYLTNKVSDFDFTTKAVADVDLNKSEPWDLPGIIYIYIIQFLWNIHEFCLGLGEAKIVP